MHLTSSDAAAGILIVSARRVVALTVVCGFVEVVGCMDAGGTYPGIMTGNTVQLGRNLARGAWTPFSIFGYAILAFMLGCMIASLMRRRNRQTSLELFISAGLLILTGIVRKHPVLRIPVEIPMLAFAMAFQGEAINRFGAVSLQTLVVTNNIVKFSDAVIGRYFTTRIPESERPALAEVLLPGLAWLTYALSAAAGALLLRISSEPLLVPAFLLVLVTFDLTRQSCQT
jgi:uncharacterized membrane protein YoaK (UPF0700 family)